jgi:hypothetical protein
VGVQGVPNNDCRVEGLADTKETPVFRLAATVVVLEKDLGLVLRANERLVDILQGSS